MYYTLEVMKAATGIDYLVMDLVKSADGQFRYDF
jgi:hypothetical protein